MKMVTAEEVESCKEEDALALSIQHHVELSTCTQTDIRENYGHEKFLLGNYCGLCAHYYNTGFPAKNCVSCPLYKVQERGCGGFGGDDDLPNSVWQDCNEAYDVWKNALNHRDRQMMFRDFQDCEKRMVMQLKLCDQGKVAGSSPARPSKGSMFRSKCCAGEKCKCGKDADHKIGEEIFDDDPNPIRHNLTAYVCHTCFVKIFVAGA